MENKCSLFETINTFEKQTKFQTEANKHLVGMQKIQRIRDNMDVYEKNQKKIEPKNTRYSLLEIIQQSDKNKIFRKNTQYYLRQT